MQNLEALQFIVSVHDQLRLVAINPYEHHILEAVLHITPHQFVSCTIGEKLKGQYKHKDCNHSYFLVARYINFTDDLKRHSKPILLPSCDVYHVTRTTCWNSFMFYFKGLFSHKWKCTHPQAIQDVDEFVCKYSTTSLAHQWIPLQWMGAVRMRVETADKNINNPHLSSPSMKVLWSAKPACL